MHLSTGIEHITIGFDIADIFNLITGSRAQIECSDLRDVGQGAERMHPVCVHIMKTIVLREGANAALCQP